MSEGGQAVRPRAGVYQVEMYDAAEQAVGTMTAGHFMGAVNLGWEYVRRDFCARFVVSRVIFDSDREGVHGSEGAVADERCTTTPA